MILVTGGCGLIGSAIIKRLRENQQKCAALDNFSRSSPDGKDAYFLDVRDARSTRDAFGGAHEIIHAAFINGTKTFYEKPDEVLEVGVKGVVNVLDACRFHKIKRFTLISSSEVCRFKSNGPNEQIPLVIPDPYNPRYSYSAGKIISEMMALHCGLFDRLIIVRPFNIYGPGMAPGHVIPDILDQFDKQKTSETVNIELIGDGNETRSFCYIDDFIDGVMIAREKGEHRGIYNIGRTEETTIRYLVEFISHIKNKETHVTQLGKLREGDLQRRRPDISKLTALGYKPKWSLLDGLTQIIQQRAKL